MIKQNHKYFKRMQWDVTTKTDFSKGFLESFLQVRAAAQVLVRAIDESRAT